jgi:hypothetical protein
MLKLFRRDKAYSVRRFEGCMLKYCGVIDESIVKKLYTAVQICYLVGGFIEHAIIHRNTGLPAWIDALRKLDCDYIADGECVSASEVFLPFRRYTAIRLNKNEYVIVRRYL